MILGFRKAGDADRQRMQRFHQLVEDADLRRDTRDFAAAALAYCSALDLMPTRTDLRVQYANMLKDSGNGQQAVQQYERSLDEQPDNLDTHLQLARALLPLGRREDARRNLEAALRLSDDCLPAREMLTELNRQEVVPPAPWNQITAEVGIEAARDFTRRSGLGWRSTDRAALSAIAAGISRAGEECAPAEPAVTIVMIVRGQALAALSGLEALAVHRSTHSFEIVVLDDASPAFWSTDVIGTMPWLRYERSAQRLGPAAAAARARRLARGGLLAFVDPTTRVCDGWLDALVARHTAFPIAGRSLENIVGVERALLTPGPDDDRGAFLMTAANPKTFGTVLVVDHYVPEPDRDAGSRNMLDIMSSMRAEGWTVAFWPRRRRPDSGYERRLQAAGITLLLPSWAGTFEDWFARNAESIDLVLLSRPSVAPPFLHTIRHYSSVPILFYGHDIHAARTRSEARLTGSLTLEREAEEMERVERRIWQQVDIALYPSEAEAQAARRLEPDADIRAIVPFCFDEFRGSRQPPTGRGRSVRGWLRARSQYRRRRMADT